jgi:CBS-domain-containing membrane protein
MSRPRPARPLPPYDLLIAPVCEGGLILVVALAAWLTHKPLIFASLGPTAYELIEQPHRRSARPYNIIMGHLIAVVAGLVAVYGIHAWTVPAVSLASVPLLRVWAASLAAALTVVGTLAARATQPAALSTTLVVSLGAMQRWQDGILIMIAILLLTAIGEPLRIWRARAIPE